MKTGGNDSDRLAFAEQLIDEYLKNQRLAQQVSSGSRVDAVFDSLGYLDFFLHLESHIGGDFTLDELVECTTLHDVAQSIANSLKISGQNIG